MSLNLTVQIITQLNHLKVYFVDESKSKRTKEIGQSSPS